VSVDPNDTEFGPYEVEQEVSPPTNTYGETSLRAHAVHDGFECDGSDSPGTCTGGGRGRVTIEANAGGQSRAVTVDTSNVSQI
jgi:hypothetical protein